MEKFAASLPSGSVQLRLQDALERNRPIRRFKDIVYSDLKLRDQWHEFRERALLQQSRDWLEALGIEADFCN